MKKIQIIVSLTFLVLFFGCKNTNSSESSQQTSTNSTDTTIEDTQNSSNEKTETTLYAWVDKLRIREKPNTKSTVIDEVKEGTSFVYLNEKTDYKDRINLRGTLYNEPWLKIKTEDEKEGWVYGGAVKFYEPIVDASPSPYDKCEDLRRKKKFEAWHSCLEKERAKQLKKDARFASSNEEGLTLTLLTGKKITLENNKTEGENFSEKIYSHYLPKIGYFVVRNSVFEGGSYSLVNDKSGKETTIFGFPKVSPDNNYVLASNADGVAGFEFNGIEIYGFPNGKFEKLFEKEWDDVEPYGAKWVDEKTIHLSLVPTELNTEEKQRDIKIAMDEKGSWGVME